MNKSIAEQGMATKKSEKQKTSRRAAKKAPPAKVFNIYYREDQKVHLDESFVPYDNSANTSHLLEFDVFRKLLDSEETKGVAYWGAVSWKFFQKTGLTGKDLFKVIEANPGYDCYFCNPHPDIESIYHNIWVQGETAHPNFLKLANIFFDVTGLDTTLLTAIFPSQYFASANYFVATESFWRAYIEFVSGIMERAERNLPLQAKQAMYSSCADPRSLHADAGYWPFFVERLFSIFLVLQGRDFKVFKFPTVSPSLDANVHHKLLLQMKDAAWKTRSNWLAVCWVNYRNLYLAEVHGRDWVRKFVEKITPSAIKFVS